MMRSGGRKIRRNSSQCCFDVRLNVKPCPVVGFTQSKWFVIKTATDLNAQDPSLRISSFSTTRGISGSTLLTAREYFSKQSNRPRTILELKPEMSYPASSCRSYPRFCHAHIDENRNLSVSFTLIVAETQRRPLSSNRHAFVLGKFGTVEQRLSLGRLEMPGDVPRHRSFVPNTVIQYFSQTRKTLGDYVQSREIDAGWISCHGGSHHILHPRNIDETSAGDGGEEDSLFVG